MTDSIAKAWNVTAVHIGHFDGLLFILFRILRNKALLSHFQFSTIMYFPVDSSYIILSFHFTMFNKKRKKGALKITHHIAMGM